MLCVPRSPRRFSSIREDGLADKSMSPDGSGRCGGCSTTLLDIDDAPRSVVRESEGDSGRNSVVSDAGATLIDKLGECPAGPNGAGVWSTLLVSDVTVALVVPEPGPTLGDGEVIVAAVELRLRPRG